MSEQTFGHYTLVRKLGEGAMGVVWSARDNRLGRSVAIKLIQKNSADPNAKSRLWREARAAASVSHPNVCHVYDVGEEHGEMFVAMELLEGEPLASRITRGPVAITEAVDISAAILDALGALHASSIVHRDLKPSNVFLTPHGVKLLDFGLARPSEAADLTTPGTLVGTPRYMAPEQWASADVGPRADLFACGAILFEMLTGRPAFGGDSLAAVCHAAVHENPPALAGGAEVQAVDRVIHRAMEKRPADRYESASAMARELRSVRAAADAGVTMPTNIRAVTRLVVPSFRLLRPDAEIDFLGVSLADAITSSLSGLESLVVRSSRSAARFTEQDIQRIGTELEVDAVLLGTILRAGSKIRVATELVDSRSATLIWSKNFQADMSDIFEVQDELTERVIEALAIPLSQREETRLRRDVPSTANAYELYLRANHVGVNVTSSVTLATARDLYRSCLTDDPKFAPAWARLGRIYRVMAKYGHGDWRENVRLAEEAFRKAFELNPDLPLAHNYYTYFEIEELGDAPGAMTRLLGRVKGRSLDPEIFAGLVTACRFCGLYDASIAAAENARRLDPNIKTSIQYTYWLLGNDEKAIENDTDDPPLVTVLAKASTENDEALRLIRAQRARSVDGMEHHAIRYVDAVLRDDRDVIREEVHNVMTSGFHDPEGHYLMARGLAKIGDVSQSLDILESIVKKNFCCHVPVTRDPWFASVREDGRLQPILEESRRRSAAAGDKFRAAGGPALLGVQQATPLSSSPASTRR